MLRECRQPKETGYEVPCQTRSTQETQAATEIVVFAAASLERFAPKARERRGLQEGVASRLGPEESGRQSFLAVVGLRVCRGLAMR